MFSTTNGQGELVVSDGSGISSMTLHELLISLSFQHQGWTPQASRWVTPIGRIWFMERNGVMNAVVCYSGKQTLDKAWIDCMTRAMGESGIHEGHLFCLSAMTLPAKVAARGRGVNLYGKSETFSAMVEGLGRRYDEFGYAHVRKQNLSLESRIEESQERERAAWAEVRALKETVESLLKERSDLKRLVSTHNSEVRRIHDLYRKSQADLSDAEWKSKEAEKRIADLEERLRLQVEFGLGLETQVNDLRRRVREEKTHHEETYARFKELQTELVSLHEAQQEFQKIANNRIQDNEVAEAKATFRRLIAELEEERAVGRDMERRLLEFNQNFRQWEEQSQGVFITLTQERDQVQAELDHALAAIRQMEGERNTLSTEVERLTAVVADQLVNEVAPQGGPPPQDMEQEYERLRKDAEESEWFLGEARAQVRELQTLRDALEEQLAQARSGAEEKERLLREVEYHLNRSEWFLGEERSKNQELLAQIQELQNEFEELKQASEDRVAEIQTSAARTVEQQSILCSELRQSVKSLREQLEGSAAAPRPEITEITKEDVRSDWKTVSMSQQGTTGLDPLAAVYDRRTHRRAGLSGKDMYLTIRVLDSGEEPIGVRVRNVGGGGVGVESPRLLPNNTRIEVAGGEGSGDLAGIQGTVIWSKQIPNSDIYHVGIAFSFEGEEIQNRIGTALGAT
ncbi:MAG: hypothetical protein JW937_09225 [Candidatus Omnitrophica bacterium]|nr:hypothetical protein [Candidatus Omnitrophota bacterium]